LNDCCKNTSSALKITVQPGIKNNLITGDTTICDNTVPSIIKGQTVLTGGDGLNYASKWKQKTGSSAWMDIAGENQYSYQPPALTDSVSYQRIITSGTCTDVSNIVQIIVLNTIQGNTISGDPVVCDGFPAGQLSSGIITGGEPGIYRVLWEKSGDGTIWELIATETSLPLMPGILPQNMHFRRKIKSGLFDCCQSTSNSHYISIDKNPDVPEAGIDRELVYQDTTTLTAKAPEIGTGVWTSSSDADISSPEKNITRIDGLKFGRHAFYWTVTNGVCPSVSDSVILHVNDLKQYTGFSPNGDGINDYFVISGLNNASNKDLTILNRWGVEVFHSPDYQNDWDGKNQKSGDPLPEDTYFYVLKVKDIYKDGNTRRYQGYIVIKR
jgi:gliding motility-associated-like protein